MTVPSTMPEDAVKNFGKQVPMTRPGQPVELATAYVMLADPLSSYVRRNDCGDRRKAIHITRESKARSDSFAARISRSSNAALAV